MDAIQLLTQQHRQLESFLKKILETKDVDSKLEHFRAAADALSTHISAEEDIFYPAVHAQRTEGVLMESLEEHLSLKRLLKDLLTLDVSDSTFEPKVKVLKEQAEHHHKEEEENLFPQVEKALPLEDRMRLGERMQALQIQLQQKGKPRCSVMSETEEAAPLKENDE